MIFLNYFCRLLFWGLITDVCVRLSKVLEISLKTRNQIPFSSLSRPLANVKFFFLSMLNFELDSRTLEKIDSVGLSQFMVV